jgi:hypothetical protein
MPLRRAARLVFAVGAAAIFSSGLAGAPAAGAIHSPQAEIVAWRDAWRQAEAFAAAQPGREVVVGRGDSMLPLYRDRTVLVLEALDMSAWRAGMTVVFIGDQGRPVAHTLVSKTRKGWIACGLANPERDRTLVQPGNYIGTVVRAFAPAADGASDRTAATAPEGERLASAGQ